MNSYRTRSLWDAILLQNVDFIGFGNWNASVCYVSDTITLPKGVDEFAIHVQLLEFRSALETFLNGSNPSGIYLPEFAADYIEQLLRQSNRNQDLAHALFIPLSTHLYFEHLEAWKLNLLNKLVKYQSFLLSFREIHICSRFITWDDLVEIYSESDLRKIKFTSLYFSNSPNNPS